MIREQAQGKKLVCTFENHSVINGLGSAVADVLAKNAIAVPLLKVGAQDVFGQVGMIDLLQKEFKLTAEDLVQDIKQALASRQNEKQGALENDPKPPATQKNFSHKGISALLCKYWTQGIVLVSAKVCYLDQGTSANTKLDGSPSGILSLWSLIIRSNADRGLKRQ